MLIVPGHPGSDLLEAGVAPPDQHLPQDAAVAVALLPLDGDDLIEDKVRKVLLGAGPEGLAALGSVDALEADAMLGFRVVKDCDRVSVGDPDDPPADNVGECRRREGAE
jgi:hypothetical protein